jgi:chaperonin cofactor prefoldin
MITNLQNHNEDLSTKIKLLNDQNSNLEHQMMGELRKELDYHSDRYEKLLRKSQHDVTTL